MGTQPNRLAATVGSANKNMIALRVVGDTRNTRKRDVKWEIFDTAAPLVVLSSGTETFVDGSDPFRRANINEEKESSRTIRDILRGRLEQYKDDNGLLEP